MEWRDLERSCYETSVFDQLSERFLEVSEHVCPEFAGRFLGFLEA